MDNNIISIFLHYGYIPDKDVKLPNSLKLWMNGDLERVDFADYKKSELIQIGGDILKNVIKEEIGNDYTKTHIIPLSGGLDSRAILANLLEHTESSKIVAVTFGLPRSKDYETAKNIAKKIGVKWEGIDLSPGNWKWNTQILLEAANNSVRPTRLFDTVINHSVQLKYGNNCVYWTGFMGDSLSRYPPIARKINNWYEAKNKFADKSCRYGKYKLTPPNYNKLECLPKYAFTDKSLLDYYSQLNYCIKQQCFTKHIYSPVGYDIRYPFINYKWLKFILSIPINHKIHQKLYRNILHSHWPHLFRKYNSMSRDKSTIDKIIYCIYNNNYEVTSQKYFSNKKTSSVSSVNGNYINWSVALKYQKDFKEVVYTNLQDLKSRNIIDWFSIDDLWKVHQMGKMNVADEILTVAALEIHLKAGTLTINAIKEYAD